MRTARAGAIVVVVRCTHAFSDVLFTLCPPTQLRIVLVRIIVALSIAKRIAVDSRDPRSTTPACRIARLTG